MSVKTRERLAYEPSWYTDTVVATPERPALTAEIDVEVCVVGGGLAGLTTARELARRGWSVVVLEARRVAWNASGRNTGFVLPGFAQDIDVIVRRVGLDHAKALWDQSVSGVEYVRRTIRETGMPGVLPVESGWLKVAKSDDGERDLEMVRLVSQDLGTNAEGWPVERVRSALKSPHYFHGVYFPDAFHIHALNYALGLASAAEAAGARIFEDSPVVSIDTEGVRKFVVTPKGRVRASHIVLAGNVHLGSLVPRIAGTLMPVWTYVITTAPLGDRLPEAIDFRGAVSDTDFADSHYRVVDGDRLMWSGGMTTWEATSLRMVSKLKGEIARIYPQLGAIDVDHVWNGVLGNALHRMPQIGELGPRLWLASGFGGHGINTTAMAGNIIARAIDEGDDSWRLFLPFELVWAGGRIGRAALQVNYMWFRSRERAKTREAQARETEYRRNEELAAAAAQQEGGEALPKPKPVVARKPRRSRSRKKDVPVTALDPSAAPAGGDLAAMLAADGTPPDGQIVEVAGSVNPDLSATADGDPTREGIVGDSDLSEHLTADREAAGPASTIEESTAREEGSPEPASQHEVERVTASHHPVDPFDAAWYGDEMSWEEARIPDAGAPTIAKSPALLRETPDDPLSHASSAAATLTEPALTEAAPMDAEVKASR